MRHECLIFIRETEEMIAAAAAEMHMLHDIVALGTSGEQGRCSAVWTAGAGAVAASTPTLTVSAAMSLFESDGVIEGAPPRWPQDLLALRPQDVRTLSSTKGLALLATAGLGPV